MDQDSLDGNVPGEPIKVDDLDESMVKAETEEQKNINAILDAVKELTKITGELKAEWEKWRRAGKF